MQCLDFESRLQSALDARQPPRSDAALSGHAAECADCRQLLAAMVAVAEYAAAMPAACPAGLTRQVLDQVQPGRRRVLPLRWAAGLAAAAALAGVLPLWSWLGSGHGPTREQTAGTNKHVQLAQAVPARPAPTQPAPARPGTAPAESWSLMPELSDFSAQNSPELTAGFNGVGDDVREGLAPLTRSTAGALESLWQALSPAEDNRS
ncbi:MAG TPA: hypothetical protein VIK18_21670 [Pirellulales bacterium]